MAKGEPECCGRVGQVEAVSIWENLEFTRQVSQHPCGAGADDAEPISFDIIATRVKTGCRQDRVDPFRDKDFGVCEVANV